jgi:hypothetical protein
VTPGPKKRGECKMKDWTPAPTILHSLKINRSQVSLS